MTSVALKAILSVAFIVGFVALVSEAQASTPQRSQDQRIARVEHGLITEVIVAGQKPTLMSLSDRMSYYHVPAVSIAFFDPSGILWARAYGATTRTLFQAASISKPVSAVGIMRLVQDGRLSLDRNVNDELTSWHIPENAFTQKQPVTLRELLSHTAGTTVHGFEGYERGKPQPTLVQVLNGQAPSNSSPIVVDILPGSAFRYSGGGYLIAQQLVIDTTHESFAKYMHDAVLEPLGMSDSTFEQPLPSDLWAQAAVANDDKGNPYPGQWHVYPELAPAGLWTTPTDLGKFAIGVQRALDGAPGAILSQATAKEMLTPVKDDYALGFGAGGTGSEAVFTHDGANAGFRALFLMHRGGQGVAIMTNADRGDLLIGELIRSIANEYAWTGYGPISKRAIALSAASLQKFVGQYKLGNGDILSTSIRDGALFLQPTGRSEIHLYPESPTKFFMLNQDLDVTFQVEPSGAVDGLSIVQYGEDGKAKRVSSSSRP